MREAGKIDVYIPRKRSYFLPFLLTLVGATFCTDGSDLQKWIQDKNISRRLQQFCNLSKRDVERHKNNEYLFALVVSSGSGNLFFSLKISLVELNISSAYKSNHR